MICSSQANRAAVIRLHSLGDVILAQPAVSELSKRYEVIFVISEQYTPLVKRMPGNIHPAPLGTNAGPLDLRKLLGRISPEIIIDLQNNIASRMATAGKTVKGRFRMDRKLRKKVMDGRIGSMPMRTSEFLLTAGFKEYSAPVLLRNSAKTTERLRIGIVTGGRWHLKSIPAGVISETSRVLKDLHRADIVLLGGREDSELILKTAEDIGRDNIDVYRGANGIEGLIETIETLDLLISPDSGPAHLASALGIPVQVVFTSTSPSLGFWREDRKGNYMVSDVGCRPCHRHGGRSCPIGTEICRKGILPFHLAETAMEILES